MFAADLQEQAARPNRPALTPATAVPGWNSGNPYRADWAGTRGQMIPVSFTNRYGALVQGDVFAPCRAPPIPTPANRWRGRSPASSSRPAEHLSFYFCSGYDIATASSRAVDDDITDVGCD